MSNYLVDVNGYVGDLATNTGLGNLYDWLDKYGLELSKEFTKQGFTDFPQALAVEIELIIPFSSEYWLDEDLKKTVDNFILMLKESKEVAIASNGETKE